MVVISLPRSNSTVRIRPLTVTLRLFYGRKFAVISGAVIRTVLLWEYGAQTAVNHENSVPFTVPYYCARYYGQIRPIYCRKYTVLTSFTVDKQTVNESVFINLGTFKIVVPQMDLSFVTFAIITFSTIPRRLIRPSETAPQTAGNTYKTAK